MKSALLLTVFSVLIPAATLAQTTSSGPSVAPASVSGATGAKLSTQDTHFIKMAAISGMAEVNDGQLATQMGATATVKKIGMTMVTDHTKANNQLMAIAKQEGAVTPTSVDVTNAAMTTRLKTLSGQTFDKNCLHDELLGHEMTITLFKAEASTGSNVALKSFASTTLPTLEHHLTMVKAAM